LNDAFLPPEVSKKNPYWVEKHRCYELKHFCRQYPIWVKAYAGLDGLIKKNSDLEYISKENVNSDPTAKCAEALIFYSERIKMVERAAEMADEDLASFILTGVTEGKSYDIMKAKKDIPCCKDVYYNLYRRFFWLLNKERK